MTQTVDLMALPAPAAEPAGPRVLSVEDILGAPDLASELVDVPEWGGSVRIQGFTKAAQTALRKEATITRLDGGKVTEEVDGAKLELLMFVHGVTEPKFTAEHVPALAQKSAGALDRVLKRILTISGLTPEAVKEAEKSPSA